MALERQEIELITKILGMKPFVVIELDGKSTGPGEDEYEIHMNATYGGGIGTSGAMGVMAEMLEQNGWTCTAPEGFDPDAED